MLKILWNLHVKFCGLLVVSVFTMLLALILGTSKNPMDPIIFFGLLAITLVLLIISHYRNYWVYENHSKVITKSTLEIYDRLLSYDEMNAIFWVWDINKFIQNKYFGFKFINKLRQE